MPFNENLKRMRKRKRLTQKELAQACQLSEITIRSYERGIVWPSKAALWRLTDALDTTPGRLMAD